MDIHIENTVYIIILRIYVFSFLICWKYVRYMHLVCLCAPYDCFPYQNNDNNSNNDNNRIFHE